MVRVAVLAVATALFIIPSLALPIPHKTENLVSRELEERDRRSESRGRNGGVGSKKTKEKKPGVVQTSRSILYDRPGEPNYTHQFRQMLRADGTPWLTTQHITGARGEPIQTSFHFTDRLGRETSVGVHHFNGGTTPVETVRYYPNGMVLVHQHDEAGQRTHTMVRVNDHLSLMAAPGPDGRVSVLDENGEVAYQIHRQTLESGTVVHTIELQNGTSVQMWPQDKNGHYKRDVGLEGWDLPEVVQGLATRDPSVNDLD